jgi:hypothetical protein
MSNLSRVTATITGVIDAGLQRPFDTFKPNQPTWAVLFTTADGEVLTRKYNKSSHAMCAMVALGQAAGVDLEFGSPAELLGKAVALSVDVTTPKFPKVTEVSRREDFDEPMPEITPDRCQFVEEVSARLKESDAKSWVMSLPAEARRLIGSRIVLRTE